MFSFKQVALQVELLSNPSETMDVYPLSSKDEIVLCTSDLLLNGGATIRIIESCIPQLEGRVNNLPFTEIQRLLIAIRIASGMGELEFNSTCPKCNYEAVYTMNLEPCYSAIALTKWNDSLVIDGLPISIKPVSFHEYNKYLVQLFRFNKQVYQLSLLANSDVPAIASFILTERDKLTRQFYLYCIDNVRGVNDRAFLQEWFDQVDPITHNRIVNHIDQAIKSTSIPDTTIPCRAKNCGGSTVYPVTLDFSEMFRAKLIRLSDEEIISVLQKNENEIKKFKKDLLQMIWYMRGSISYEEAMQLSRHERDCISEIIKSNIESTIKTKMPLI